MFLFPNANAVESGKLEEEHDHFFVLQSQLLFYEEKVDFENAIFQLKTSFL